MVMELLLSTYDDANESSVTSTNTTLTDNYDATLTPSISYHSLLLLFSRFGLSNRVVGYIEAFAINNTDHYYYYYYYYYYPTGATEITASIDSHNSQTVSY